MGFLIKNKKQSSTIKSYISAIKAVLRCDRITMNENRYLLNALTKSCKLTNDKVRIRLPIQKGILRILIKYLKRIFATQPYLSKLYQAMFLTAYFGLFRVSELATGQHAVKAIDVRLGKNKNKVLFILRTSKTHGKKDKPQLIKISHCDFNQDQYSIKSTETWLSPFEAIINYLAVR